jgi:hypothetical protein
MSAARDPILANALPFTAFMRLLIVYARMASTLLISTGVAPCRIQTPSWEAYMKPHRTLTALLFGMLALAALAPMASAKSHDRDDHGRARDRAYDSRDDRSDRGRSDDSYWRDDRDRRGSYSRRDYYYRDPYCGQKSQYMSDFKGHYDRANHPPLLEKIDIRSGQCLATYRYDYRAQEWRSWNRGLSWNGDRSYNRGFDRRGTGVYGGYPSRDRVWSR